MNHLDKRLAAMEDAALGRVVERILDEEIDEMLSLLERRLEPEKFSGVLRVVASWRSGRRGRGRPLGEGVGS